jgi:hypothetical protein
MLCSYVIVTWSYSHASSDICWENAILHIVMIIQFNFENNTQIPSVKVCIHFLADPVHAVCLKLLSLSLNHLKLAISAVNIEYFRSGRCRCSYFFIKIKNCSYQCSRVCGSLSPRHGASSVGPCHHGMARPLWVPVTTAWRVLRLRMEERLPIWRAAANTLNNQWRTADEGWSSSLGVGRGANNSSPWKAKC